MCNEQRRGSNCQCLTDILKVIVGLQQREDREQDQEGCDKPFLGPCPSTTCFNTRPINLYNCCTGTLWTISYTLNDTTGTSSVFRVENVDDCCCTCRVLAPNPDATVAESPYVATDTFFTIDLGCVSALRCLTDVYVPCI